MHRQFPGKKNISQQSTTHYIPTLPTAIIHTTAAHHRRTAFFVIVVVDAVSPPPPRRRRRRRGRRRGTLPCNDASPSFDDDNGGAIFDAFERAVKSVLLKHNVVGDFWKNPDNLAAVQGYMLDRSRRLPMWDVSRFLPPPPPPPGTAHRGGGGRGRQDATPPPPEGGEAPLSAAVLRCPLLSTAVPRRLFPRL